MSRDNSLAAMRARYERATDTHLTAIDSSLDVRVLLKRLGAEEEPDPELGFLPPMVVTMGDSEIFAACGDCEAPLGSIRPDGRLDTLFLNWERHTLKEHPSD